MGASPGGASGVFCGGLGSGLSPVVASEGVLTIDEVPDSVTTAQAGAFFGGWLREGVESTLVFKACLVELGVFFSAFSAHLSSFLINLLSS